VASLETIEAAAGLLNRSLRPVIVAGGGVHDSGATGQLAAVADRLSAVVVTSFSGKGSISETSTHAAGVLNPLGTTESLELARRAHMLFWMGLYGGPDTN